MEEDRVPDTLPATTDIETYATDVIMTAGCETDQGVLAVAANHQHESTCETLATVAACGNEEGDFFEVGAYFLWTSLRPDIVSIPSVHGSEYNLAYLYGQKDIFDEGGAGEPTSTIIACVMNDCPTDPGSGMCQDMACATATVASVVNLEGTWELTGETIQPGTFMSPLQDGRTFGDDALGAWRGRIDGSLVRFEIGDYRFDGHVLPDRNALSGTVTEMMGNSVIGPWSATRISP
jgi:hypothetical protein